MLGAIVEHALSAAAARRGFAVLEEDGTAVADCARDTRRGGIDAEEVELAGPVWREALRTMRPVRTTNADDDPLLAACRTGGEPRSILCVPFVVPLEGKGDTRGALLVERPLREGAFDARAERMVELCADLAGLAIAQSRRVVELRRQVRELESRVASAEPAQGLRTLEELERAAILQALGVAGNDKRKAAKLLGISRAKVYQRLK